MKLYSLLKNIQYEIISGNVDIDIKSITYDSRKVTEKSVFVCINGANVDGHDYIKEAVKKGALAIVIEEELQVRNENITVIKVENSKLALASLADLFYSEPSKEVNLIGVTGTNGKTTVVHYIKDILEANKKRTAVIGTLGYEFENKEAAIQKINPTTPESLELQGLFREFADKGAENVVIEVTSQALAKERVECANFNVGVFTNLSQDHLDEHGTMENYKNEKIKLFKKCSFGVINIDDKIAEEIIKKASCKILTYGINNEADIRATEIRYKNDCVIFKIKFKNISWSWWCMQDVKVNIPGKVTVYNTLAAIGACIGLGMDISDIISVLSNLKYVPGRLEMVNNKANKNVIVDYAHTPDALERLLLMARETTDGRLVTIFGCGGDRDKTKRKVMGMAAGVLSDYCIITSDNPRTEDPEKIIEDVEEGMNSINSTYEKIVDRREAIERGLRILKEDDLLIITADHGTDPRVIERKISDHGHT